MGTHLEQQCKIPYIFEEFVHTNKTRMLYCSQFISHAKWQSTLIKKLIIIIIIQKICSTHISTLLGAQGANPENTGASPFSFMISVLGSFTCINTTHGTYSFTSHPKDEAIMVKCLAQGHKRRGPARPGFEPTF